MTPACVACTARGAVGAADYWYTVDGAPHVPMCVPCAKLARASGHTVQASVFASVDGPPPAAPSNPFPPKASPPPEPPVPTVTPAPTYRTDFPRVPCRWPGCAELSRCDRNTEWCPQHHSRLATLGFRGVVGATDPEQVVRVWAAYQKVPRSHRRDRLPSILAKESQRPAEPAAVSESEQLAAFPPTPDTHPIATIAEAVGLLPGADANLVVLSVRAVAREYEVACREVESMRRAAEDAGTRADALRDAIKTACGLDPATTYDDGVLIDAVANIARLMEIRGQSLTASDRTIRDLHDQLARVAGRMLAPDPDVSVSRDREVIASLLEGLDVVTVGVPGAFDFVRALRLMVGVDRG